MSSITRSIVTALVLILLCSIASAQYSANTQAILYRTCLLNQGSDLWSTVSDCTTFSTTYPINSAVTPGCIFGTFQVSGQGELYYIKADPSSTPDCTWNDPQVLPLEVSSAIHLSTLSFSGPQAELSGKDFSGLTMLSILRQNNVSFSAAPIWPDVTQAYYINQSEPVQVPVQSTTTSSLHLIDSNYHGNSITTQAKEVIINNCVFPMGLNLTGTYPTGTASLTNVDALDLTISVPYKVVISSATVTGDVKVTTAVAFVNSVISASLTTDVLVLGIYIASIGELQINPTINYMEIRQLVGNLTQLALTDDLIGLVIITSPDLVGEVIFPNQLAPTSNSNPFFTGISTSNIITIQNTQLTGLLTFPIGVTTFTVSNNKFTGNVPSFDSYPESLIALDIRNNYITLCTGYPDMGPKIPHTIPSGSVLLYPQYANVTCYCVAGNCLSGNGFPAHYQGTPAIYQSVDCISTAPVEDTYCLIGFWSIVGNHTVAQGETLNAGKGLAVQGDLIVLSGGGLSYDLSENPVQVQGVLEFQPDSALQLNLDDDKLSSLRGKSDKLTVTVPIVRSDHGVSGDISNLKFSHTLAGKSCNRVTDSSVKVVKGSLAAIMTIDGSKCKGPSQWSKATIIGVTVGIVVAVVAVVLAGALLVTYNTKVRRFVRPFTARSESGSSEPGKV